jgi:N-acetylglucosaminyldiphosphoundecaprenol N-acetyl-beta-D-mannosaminyltransferase
MNASISQPEKVNFPSLNVLGIPIHATTLDNAAYSIVEMAHSGQAATIAIAAVHSVVDAQDDPQAKYAMSGATLCVSDGVPLVWLLRLCGFRNITRVFGPDLMLEVSHRLAETGLAAFYLGGAEGVAEELAKRLERTNPGLKTAGVFSPPFREMSGIEKDQLVDMINASGARIAWVGLGSPKQERWMNEFGPRLRSAVLIGVGAAFDYNTGRLTRAPVWMQKCALEWLYRLIQEPRRLWRRYMRNNPLFVWYVTCQWLGINSFQDSGKTPFRY